jgi:hypothetical protein
MKTFLTWLVSGIAALLSGIAVIIGGIFLLDAGFHGSELGSTITVRLSLVVLLLTWIFCFRALKRRWTDHPKIK